MDRQYLEGAVMSIVNRRNQTIITFQPGEIIFHEGARGDKMFIIHTGEVKLTKKVEDLEIPLQNLKPGSMFGEMALIDNQPRSATAQAVTDVTCTVVSKMVFRQKLASEVPKWMQRMFVMLVQRVRLMIVNSSSSTTGMPGHQLVDVLYLLLQQAEPDDAGRLALPWDGIVERIAYILGLPRKSVDSILKLIVKSGLAASHIDGKNSKIFVAKSQDSFAQFDQFCKERYLVERRRKVPEDEANIRRQEAEIMGILGRIIGLDEGVHTIAIDELSRRLESEHRRSLDHYSSAIKRLLNARVLETAESKFGGLIYNIDFDLYKTDGATADLRPVFSEILEKISKLGKSAEVVEPDNLRPLAAITG
ncbi:Crp/Fnr family transcriptional regulator [Candidatus Neomarinimicrobiota bacterium]